MHWVLSAVLSTGHTGVRACSRILCLALSSAAAVTLGASSSGGASSCGVHAARLQEQTVVDTAMPPRYASPQPPRKLELFPCNAEANAVNAREYSCLGKEEERVSERIDFVVPHDDPYAGGFPSREDQCEALRKAAFFSRQCPLAPTVRLCIGQVVAASAVCDAIGVAYAHVSALLCAWRAAPS